MSRLKLDNRGLKTPSILSLQRHSGRSPASAWQPAHSFRRRRPGYHNTAGERLRCLKVAASGCQTRALRAPSQRVTRVPPAHSRVGSGRLTQARPAPHRPPVLGHQTRDPRPALPHNQPESDHRLSLLASLHRRMERLRRGRRAVEALAPDLVRRARRRRRGRAAQPEWGRLHHRRLLAPKRRRPVLRLRTGQVRRLHRRARLRVQLRPRSIRQDPGPVQGHPLRRPRVTPELRRRHRQPVLHRLQPCQRLPPRRLLR